MKKKKHKDWSGFDMIAFLEEHGINYATSGKNIGQGYFGIETCPFCEAPGNHFGVRFETNVGSCFVCGETASAPRIVQAITDMSWKDVYKAMGEFVDDDRWIPSSPQLGDEVQFPDGIVDLTKAAANYVSDRNFNVERIKKLYKVKCTTSNSWLEIGDHKWCFNYRIIIPIIMDRRVVAYTGRTYIGEDPRYMNSPMEGGIIPAAGAIYNIDTVKDKAILFEGPTDVWRFGSETAAMMGVKFTKDQIAFIRSKRLREVFVVFDEGAAERTRELCIALSSVVGKVKAIYLNTKKDPGDLSPDEALKIKYELLGRV